MAKAEYANQFVCSFNPKVQEATIIFFSSVSDLDESFNVVGHESHEVANIVMTGHSFKQLLKSIESVLNQQKSEAEEDTN